MPLPAGSNLVSNGDFELDPSSLAQWELVGEPMLVPGIAPSSGQAASLDAGQRLLQQVDAESDWYMDFYFELLETSGRAFNLVFNVPGSEVNIRIEGSIEDGSTWNTFTDDDQWGDPLELPGVVAEERYFIRVVGRGWNGDSPSYDILFSEPGGVALLHRLEHLTFPHWCPHSADSEFPLHLRMGRCARVRCRRCSLHQWHATIRSSILDHKF